MPPNIPKAIPFKIQKSLNHALLVQLDNGPYFYDKLHYHPAFQLTAIEQGEGIFYAGNQITNYNQGDVFLIGPNVPHLLKSAAVFYTDNSPGVAGVSLFFDQSSFGERFFELKELTTLKALLATSNRVIKMEGALKEKINRAIFEMPTKVDAEIIISFLHILQLIEKSEKNYLNSAQYKPTLSEKDGGRLDAVLAHIFQHYHQNITVDDVCQVAFLSRSQFSQFFKKHTGKTFISFLNELRIEKACGLLSSTSFTVERICYEVGFKNVSNFLRHFKKTKTLSPSAYRKAWQKRL